MGEKLVVGPFNRGLRNDRPPFMIDNDSFPTLVNSYQWRGRIKRKRGTQFLTRLQRFFNSTISSYSSTSTIVLDGSGSANILTGFGLEATGNIVLGSVTITDTTSGNVFTDNSLGVLTGVPGGTGTINYATGAITITGGAGHTISVIFSYFPGLPVMGLEDLILLVNQFPGTLGFDTKYSYNINTAFPYTSYDVSFYKNVATGTFVGYTQKTNWTPTSWNGQDYQQFWTTNYLGALWATNGINIPFNITNIGMQFKPITTVTVTAGGPPATATLTIANHGLVVGDFVFINEVLTTTGINFQTGYVIAVIDPNNVSVEFPNATIAANGTGGIAQYLTNRSDTTKDCIRWYDGDPTNGNATNPVFVTGKGWVNFMPPLSQANFSIDDSPPQQYYLAGARMILPFKDRLLFFGPVIQTSAAGSQLYLQDAVVFSQNGTPYYTASFTGNPLTSTTVFNPILVPANQIATPTAYWEDQTGFGGSAAAGIDRPITTVSPNEDALIVGFDSNVQSRLIYSGNDIVPFNFFLINSDMGSSSTFSIINMDYGVITRGNRGFIITSQTEVERIDTPILDEVFEIKLTSNGTERVTAQRDFINEWIYFTFPSDLFTPIFPTKTLQYNYRDNTWAVFYESYTTYGQFRKQTGFTWATAGDIYPSWDAWNDPWDTGESELEQPIVIGGNQQGFVLVRGVGTGEDTSLSITNISGTTVTSPNHCLNTNDFIIITGVIGTLDPFVNFITFKIKKIDENSFSIPALTQTGTYLGGGLITRIYVPIIQTKQFPMAWDIARKTRIGPQQYLFTTTSNGQVTVQIFLSQNGANPYTSNILFPDPNSPNNSLVYNQILYTCPESTNLGLTPANINLQIPTSAQQAQTWHRSNTSLIGDTVQIGFTLSDDQILQENASISPITITGASQTNPCVLTCTAPFNVENNSLVFIDGVVGMTQLNGNIFHVVTSSPTTITIDVNASLFAAYISGGTLTVVASNPFAEIELHGMILDLSPSMVLA